MSSRALRKTVLCMALGLSLASIVMLPSAYAANNDGSVYGQSIAGAEVTVRNPETGFTRSVTADTEGNYRFPFLPIGNYTLQASKDGAAIGTPTNVTVSLGNATNVDIGSGTNLTTLGTVQVIGSGVITPVDVTSTESATNLTSEQLSRLPVASDPLSVALLTPGLTRGDSALGGVSFGGSSVAENTIYVNGLNVTDFYNRIGFSQVPYSFYKEFQIKTGGYSVEFGRTTGGVINAVTKSGTNKFEYGAELRWEPSSLQSAARDRFTANGTRYFTARHDEYDRASLTGFASGPIVRDRLFFFAMYEARKFEPVNTSTSGTTLFEGEADTPFWGTKLDWQITDSHLLELLAFSDKNESSSSTFPFNPDTGDKTGPSSGTTLSEGGGINWALTYTGYLTDDLSVKAMYGENDRARATRGSADLECNKVFDNRPAPLRGDKGCTFNTTVLDAVDTREAMRLDFEWALGDHLLRFGLDREVNTSEFEQFAPGPDNLRYDVFATRPGSALNGAVVPPGVTAYVRTRKQSNRGTFETLNAAYYLEDNWSVTDNLVLNLGLRVEEFDNKDANGDSYIRIKDMVAPRLGFSWDVKGNGRSKAYGNIGRYFLPVANVINIKQAGPFLDERFFYVFNGYRSFDYNGQTYQIPILGPQIGGVDNTQGNGLVGDTRGKVDSDMDPVYQDEAILGFQSMIDDKWSWGIRGIYRKLHNAIDDMNINANGACGTVGAPGFIMANPGKILTIYGDTNCDGIKDGWVTIDTSSAGWALRTSPGNVFRGQRGWDEPTRDYQALELVIDRAWDERWALNASYTFSKTRGNAEGPVTSDFNFGDAGRTEAFDDPWVNYNAYGYLANDRRHQFKARGTFAFNENWEAGATFDMQSGRPISAFGVGNPFDNRDYHSFYVCVANCRDTDSTQRVYEFIPRGTAGRTPWAIDVGASLAYLQTLGNADLKVKFAVYNLLNRQKATQVNENFDLAGINRNPDYGQENGFQSPRYGQLTVSLDF
ncbi:MAG: TonB-dependent receptor [Luteimonas sp.]